MAIKEPQDILKEQIDKVTDWLSDSDESKDKTRSIVTIVVLLIAASLVLTPFGNPILYRLHLPFSIYTLRLLIGIPLGLALLIKVVSLIIKGNVVTVEMVAQQWPPQLIEYRENAIDEIQKRSEELISMSADPRVKIERKAISAGYIQGVLGMERSCLDIHHTKTRAIKPFHMYVFFRQYGTNILTTWYLAARPTPLEACLMVISKVPGLRLITFPIYYIGNYGLGRGQAGILGLDLFAKQDLSAYSQPLINACLEPWTNTVRLTT